MVERRSARGGASAVVAALFVLVAAVVVVPPAAAQAPSPDPAPAREPAPSTDPAVAPVTVRSNDGRSVSDGVRTLRVSIVDGLDPDGTTVTVTGTGYDLEKGIYVAFCLVPPADQAPTPCGGGADLDGTTGASKWISSRPPSYGEGLVTPYDPGGSFAVDMAVSAEINPTIDCRQAACALVTRNDHTRTTDRSQDLFVPVTFGEPGATPVAPPDDPDDVVVPTTVPPATAAPPSTTIDDSGRTVSDGTRRLTVSQATGLSPDGTDVEVAAEGFDEANGIYVSLCALDDAGGASGPCRTGSPEVSKWVSSDPPDYAVDLATPYDGGGSFTTTLRLEPVIDAETDCREVACGVVTRNDDAASDAEPQTLAIPVSFGSGGGGGTAASSGGGGFSLMPVAVVALIVAVAVAVSVPRSLRRRERRIYSLKEAR